MTYRRMKTVEKGLYEHSLWIKLLASREMGRSWCMDSKFGGRLRRGMNAGRLGVHYHKCWVRVFRRLGKHHL